MLIAADGRTIFALPTMKQGVASEGHRIVHSEWALAGLMLICTKAFLPAVH